MNAAAIVMGPNPTRASMLGRTAETVLAERPCRVLINLTPEQQEKLPAGLGV